MAFSFPLKTYQNVKVTSVQHRYISATALTTALQELPVSAAISTLGSSVLNNDIFKIEMGTGKKRILLWSQMHGNESTTTKAILDILQVLHTNSELAKSILNACTLCILPMLNPDGATAYTRVNANGVDLNRDAKNLSQPESKVLHDCFTNFKPDYCFNLHGQRTIFGVGTTNKPATISFLAPAENAQRSVTHTRKKAMQIIVAMQEALQKSIPSQIGLYDDTFNINCVGDKFQSLQVPTILVEAGHYPNDYQRETTRFFVVQALLKAFYTIAHQRSNTYNYASYFSIPANAKSFYDIIIRNALMQQQEHAVDIAIQYQEVLKNEYIHFIPKVEKIGALSSFFAHREIPANYAQISSATTNAIQTGNAIDCVEIKSKKISLSL